MRVCLSFHKCIYCWENEEAEEEGDEVENGRIFYTLTMIYGAFEWNMFRAIYCKLIHLSSLWSSFAFFRSQHFLNTVSECPHRSLRSLRIDIAAWFPPSNPFWLNRLQVEPGNLLFWFLKVVSVQKCLNGVEWNLLIMKSLLQSSRRPRGYSKKPDTYLLYCFL